jgi:hypothetical protein
MEPRLNLLASTATARFVKYIRHVGDSTGDNYVHNGQSSPLRSPQQHRGHLSWGWR